MGPRFSSGDVSGFKCLICLGVLYGVMSVLVYEVIHMKHIKPIGFDAPLDRFSEARAVEHVRVLAEEIGGRQEGSPGLGLAAKYIKSQLEKLAERAGSNIRIEVEENVVGGSFNMMFLGHSISLAYRNHTNVLMRISSIDSKDGDPSVLFNGHFDSPLGSPGAGDCASCVASMLELARLTVDSGWIPPHPIIFLFNGAEELFLLGSHGFVKTHNWSNTIGAFVNIEASGTGGLDLVCQSGPGSWSSLIYSQAAMYPMAHSAAQDVFPVIPGDTDYRIFAEDDGNIPGLDIIFVLGGYFYHTSYDTVERLLPGSIQARGENLFSILKAFSSSSELQNANGRAFVSGKESGNHDDRAVFFDYLSWFMIFYSRRQALLLHSLPGIIFLLMPFVLNYPNIQVFSLFATFCDFGKGILLHTIGVILAIIVPITFAILRLSFSGYAMSWFTHPYLAFLMFIPCSLVGLVIPRILWGNFPLSQGVSTIKTSNQVLSDEARFWGAFGLYTLITLVYLAAGLGGGFLTLFLLVSMIPARILFCMLNKHFGYRSTNEWSLVGFAALISMCFWPGFGEIISSCFSARSIIGYTLPMIPSLIYTVYFGGFLVQFLIEKMGMMGSLPQPYGYFVPDIIVAAAVGVVTGFCVGPLLPVVGHWLARSSIVQFLLHFSVLALALSSQFFPYSKDAPKRLVLQHTFVTADGNRIVDSSYDFSVVDSNSLRFLFKYAPEAAEELHLNQKSSFENINTSERGTWMALFPVSFLFSGSLKFPAKSEDMLKHYGYLPHLSINKPTTHSSSGSRKVFLELDLGSLEEVWVTVLNITGPLSGWSFADNQLPAPEVVDGGPPSYICRISGASHENWTFWLEANSSDPLNIDVVVLDQYLASDFRKLKGLFPSWVDVTAYSSFLSSYVF